MLKRTGILRVARTQIDLPNSPLYVDADRALLEGVLINLLKNAAEALAEKAEAFSRDDRDDDENGPGVARENLDRLFKTYFTTKTGAGGTGLGLAIVRETVEQHGGRIDVVSALGEGTRFTVLLPLAGCPPMAASDEPAASRGGSVVRLVPSV